MLDFESAMPLDSSSQIFSDDNKIKDFKINLTTKNKRKEES